MLVVFIGFASSFASVMAEEERACKKDKTCCDESKYNCCSKVGDHIKLQYAIPGVTNECYTDKVVKLQGGKIKLQEQKVHYVKNLTEYITGIYNLFIGLLALAATVMIMAGGMQWLLAAGSQQKISSAKTTITSAIGGLVLALLSYTILQTINPNLTTLTLTDVDPIKKIDSSLYCSNFPGAESGDTKFVVASDYEDNPTEEANLGVEDTQCGVAYYSKQKNESEVNYSTTCLGQKCPRTGSNFTGVNDYGNACYQGGCISGAVYGKIKFDPGRYLDGDMYLKYVCKNQQESEAYIQSTLSKDNLGTPSSQRIGGYVLPQSAGYSNAEIRLMSEGGGLRSFGFFGDKCGGEENIKGFFLDIEVNDQYQVLGANIGPGVDDRFAIVPTGNVCQLPITQKDDKGNITDDPGKIDWSKEVDLPAGARWISLEDVKNGFRCDINITSDLAPR